MNRNDLILKDVSFTYPNGYVAVEHINMHIRAGENVAIIGQNGAGKTTTVKLMNGLFKPTEGNVLVGEKNTKEFTTAQISRIVGYVFQNPDDQIFHSTVESEVAYGPKALKIPESEVKERVEQALKITGMDAFRKENPFNLPLSTRKFVTIAAVIAMNTDILIFDEPTAGQDVEGNKRLSNILQVLHEQGKTVIIISHDMEFVIDHFEHLIVMAKKQVQKIGSPQEIFWDYKTLDQAMLKQPYVSRVCKALGIEGNVVTMDQAVEKIMGRYRNAEK